MHTLAFFFYETTMARSIEETLFGLNVEHKKEKDYYLVTCPYHNDTHPSGNIYKNGRFRCWSCGVNKSLDEFLAVKLNVSLFDVKKLLGHSRCNAPISPTEVERDHLYLNDYPDLKKELYKRKIDDDTIKKYRIGAKRIENEIRISIPVFNSVGEYFLLRLYKPGAFSRKFLNYGNKLKTTAHLFPMDQLEYDEILVCGGEIKALAAAIVLNNHGIGAVAPTCGENVWPMEYSAEFKNKIVYINCDLDETGRKGAEIRCRSLMAYARQVNLVELPRNEYTPEKYDINDFLAEKGDLYHLIINSQPFRRKIGDREPQKEEEEISNVLISEAFLPESIGRKMRVEGKVAAICSEQYLIPKEVGVQCSRSHNFCISCEVNLAPLTELENKMYISTDHPGILSFVHEPTKTQDSIFRDLFSVSKQCTECQFFVRDRYSVIETRVDEKVDKSLRHAPITNKIFFVLNPPDNFDSRAYEFVGRLHPSPKNQMAVFVASKATQTEDTIDSCELPSREEFALFQPKEWTLESLEAKLDEIYHFIEQRITHIWQRRDMHIAWDLTYHSPLYFQFNNNRLNGWVELLVVGDTGQGKSHLVSTLYEYYGLGEKIDCGNVTLAGLTIGLTHVGGRYFSSMGAMPKNDRGLVIFEEFKEMDPKIFKKLKEIRSSGEVAITKIESKSKLARVRIIAFSNPEDGRSVNSYNFGIDSAISVVPTPEDLRRFDMVMIVGADDICNLHNEAAKSDVPLLFSPDLASKLIIKAWKTEKVHFESEHAISEAAKRLSDKFGLCGPILDSVSAPNKVAKLSAALAARTHSYDGDDVLYVRLCHVEFIEKFLDRIYSSKSSKLDLKNKLVLNSTKLRDTDMLVKYLRSIPNGGAILKAILEIDELTSTIVKDIVGDISISATLFAKLIQTNAIRRLKGNTYIKNTEFTKTMKKVNIDESQPAYLQLD